MKNFFLIALSALSLFIHAQTVPVGIPVLEDYVRRQQLLGDSSVNASLMIRPSNGLTSDKKTKLELMPVVWKQQYTTDHPLSMNDGAMIPARGYQTLISAGFFARYSIFSLQFMPEMVYARNLPFEGFPLKHKKEAWQAYNSLKSRIDNPDRFGYDPYQRFFWGQSSLRINVKSLSLGISNENLWWGPGHNNALMMSNTAPGFKHLSFNTRKPVNTPVGSFEWQLISGWLEPSGFYGLDTADLKSKGVAPYTLRNDRGYVNAMTVNYQPRWLPGLSLGGARTFTVKSKDIRWSNYKTWFPVAEPFLKVNAGGHGYDTIPTDQIVTVWARWLMPKEHSEIYLEFGRVDHNWHLNDFLMEPAHTRAYIAGFRKLIPLAGPRKSLLDVQFELTQFSHNVPTFLRPYSGMISWYNGGFGFTNHGQILGAGIGTSSNMQVVNLAWVNGKKRIGLELYRLNHDDDFWEHLKLNRMADYRTHWIDISGALEADWDYRDFLFNLKVQTVGSLNYMFLYDPVLTEPPYFWDYGKTRYNVNLMLSVVWNLNKLNL